MTAFWGAWLLVGLAVTRWRVRLEWDGGFHPSVLVRGGILFAAVVRRWLVIIAGLVVSSSSTFASGSLGEKLLIAAGALFLPYAVIEWYIGGRATRHERRIAGDSLSEHRKVAAGIYRLEMLHPLLLLTLPVWLEIGPAEGQ